MEEMILQAYLAFVIAAAIFMIVAVIYLIIEMFR